ncbi:MAG: hypothetical protein ACXAEE_05140 [Candidatus Thorarchaeota archaeon]
MSMKKKRLKLLGIILLLVAVIFWFLESFRIIIVTMSSEGVTIIMLTIFLPAIVGVCLLVAGAAMKSE